MVKITGDVRDGTEFRFSAKPDNAAPSTFAAVLPNELRVTRHATQLFTLPGDTPVLAHWHGQYRTEGFATAVGELKAKADLLYGPDALDNAVKEAKALGITVKIERNNKHIVASISGYGTTAVPQRDAHVLVESIRDRIAQAKVTAPTPKAVPASPVKCKRSAKLTGPIGTALGTGLVASSFVPGSVLPGFAPQCGTGTVN